MNNVGVVGMAVMGMNLALNIADNGYQVAIYNRTYAVTQDVEKKYPQLKGYQELKDFVQSLEKPRTIILMVKAGKPVDGMIEQLIPLLDKDDLIIDGGNSNFHDTIARTEKIQQLGLRFMGVGVSGGEEGARRGPAIMPGGDSESYQRVADMLQKIAAKVDGRPCVSYIGDNGAGHYVKMVHNGIEYADMQIIAESYSLLKNVVKLDNEQLAQVYHQWNQGELKSYLIEITAQIFETKDQDGNLVEKILDKAAQKGTGLWTVEASLNQAVDASMIAQAVYARIMSGNKEQRVVAHDILAEQSIPVSIDDDAVETIRQALYAAKIISYAQGFDLMRHAKTMYQWQLDLSEIALNFRGGCIIRAGFLNRIAQAYQNDSELSNLMLDPSFTETLNKYIPSLRKVVALGVQRGISMPAFTTAISYYDAYRTKDSNANLIQAQRDFFGAHTFERTDKEGVFHHEWQ